MFSLKIVFPHPPVSLPRMIMYLFMTFEVSFHLIPRYLCQMMGVRSNDPNDARSNRARKLLEVYTWAGITGVGLEGGFYSSPIDIYTTRSRIAEEDSNDGDRSLQNFSSNDFHPTPKPSTHLSIYNYHHDSLHHGDDYYHLGFRHGYYSSVFVVDGLLHG